MHKVTFSKYDLGGHLTLFTIIGIEYGHTNMSDIVLEENIEVMKHLLIKMTEKEVEVFYSDTSKYGLQSIVLEEPHARTFSRMLAELKIPEDESLSYTCTAA